MILPSGSDHTGRKRARDSDTGDHLSQVGSQSEGHRPVGVQLPGHVVHVELEVGHVGEAGVLVDVEDVRVESAQVENVLSKPGQSQLEGDDLQRKYSL